MITAISVYENVGDNASFAENGAMKFSQFNRIGEMANLWMVSHFTGGDTGLTPPANYITQKNKDYIQHLINTNYSKSVSNGEMAKPDNYYLYERMYRIGHKDDIVCGDDNDVITGKNTPIELLDGAQFEDRKDTPIEECRPTADKPIATFEGDVFYFAPRSLGTVNLRYIRYPVAGKIVTKLDTVYKKLVPDPALSTSFDWPEFARPLLVWFIVDGYATFSRESQLAQKAELMYQKLTA